MLGNDGELLGTVIERPLDLGAAFDRCCDLRGVNVRCRRVDDTIGHSRKHVERHPAFSISGRAASVALEHPPPMMANTLCSYTSFLTAAMPPSGLHKSSSRTSTSLRPWMPPFLLSSLK